MQPYDQTNYNSYECYKQYPLEGYIRIIDSVLRFARTESRRQSGATNANKVKATEQ